MNVINLIASDSRTNNGTRLRFKIIEGADNTWECFDIRPYTVDYFVRIPRKLKKKLKNTFSL